MMAFDPIQGTRFAATANFDGESVANFSLHRSNLRDIPLHVSLRYAEQLVAINSCKRGIWQDEALIPVALFRQRNSVELKCSALGLELSINGTSLGQVVDNRGAASVKQLSVNGGWVHPVVQPAVQVSRSTRLQIVQPLMLVAKGIGDQNATIELTPAKTRLQCHRVNPDTAILALPGSIWRNVEPSGQTTMRLWLNDAPTGHEVNLTRRQLSDAIKTALWDTGIGADTLAGLQSAEHAFYAGIDVNGIHPRCRDTLLEAARTYKLPLADRYSSPQKATDELEHAQNAVRAAVGRVIANTGTPPDVSELLKLMQPLLPHPLSRRNCLLQLADPYCQNGNFDILWEVHKRLDEAPIVLSGQAWRDALALPFLARSGDFNSVARGLRELATCSVGWHSTAPLADAVRYSVEHCDPGAIRDAVVSGFFLFLQQRAVGYWGLGGCRHLGELALSLISHCCYATSTNLSITERAFGDLFALQAVRAMAGATEPAECSRIPLERFLSQVLHGKDASKLTPVNADQALRLAAHPAVAGTPVVQDQDLSEVVRRATNNVPRKAHRAECVALLRAARAWIEGLQTGDHDRNSADAMIEQAQRLSSAEHGNFGFGILLAALGGAGNGGLSNAYEPLLGAIRETARRENIDWSSPAVAGPRRRLCSRIEGILHDLLPMKAYDKFSENRMDANASPLFDTVVCVLSCQANLHTRIPALRQGWLADLETLGIPYLIAVGGKETKQQGDFLQLCAPDSYEGLPQKTLALVDWVRCNTGFSHMIKIDDDCLLNVEKYFADGAHLRHDYFGRVLYRRPGQLDRGWHMSRNGESRAPERIDKSPEPSTYADGGSAYAMSRHAMECLIAQANSPAGRQLVAVSLLEDKLVGDLLAMGGIEPSCDDYDTAVFRRTKASGPAVSRWQSGFMASRDSPARVVHLDAGADPESAAQRMDKPGLWPPKIWPTYTQAVIGENSNAVELVSPQAKLARLNATPIAVVSVVRNERPMLPSFLAHYRRLGVECFHIVDNCSDDGTLDYLLEQPDVVTFSADTDYNRSHYGVAWQQAILANFRQGRWSLLADADELLLYPGWQSRSLDSYLRTIDQEETVRLFMIDLYGRGPLSEARVPPDNPFKLMTYCDRIPVLQESYFCGPFNNSRTWTSALRHRLMPGSRPELFVAQKVALLKYRSTMRLSEGLHYLAGAETAKTELIFAHMKYTEFFHQKARIEAGRGQHFNAGEEYRAYLAMLDTSDEGFFDPAISVQFDLSPFVADRLTDDSSEPSCISPSSTNWALFS